jgi:hypothetical protein
LGAAWFHYNPNNDGWRLTDCEWRQAIHMLRAGRDMDGGARGGEPSMNNGFFEYPILNSPYDCPARHWELDETGQPTQQVLESRRRAEFITPIPKPRKRKG